MHCLLALFNLFVHMCFFELSHIKECMPLSKGNCKGAASGEKIPAPAAVGGGEGELAMPRLPSHALGKDRAGPDRSTTKAARPTSLRMSLHEPAPSSNLPPLSVFHSLFILSPTLTRLLTLQPASQDAGPQR